MRENFIHFLMKRSRTRQGVDVTFHLAKLQSEALCLRNKCKTARRVRGKGEACPSTRTRIPETSWKHPSIVFRLLCVGHKNKTSEMYAFDLQWLCLHNLMRRCQRWIYVTILDVYYSIGIVCFAPCRNASSFLLWCLKEGLICSMIALVT